MVLSVTNEEIETRPPLAADFQVHDLVGAAPRRVLHLRDDLVAATVGTNWLGVPAREEQGEVAPDRGEVQAQVRDALAVDDDPGLGRSTFRSESAYRNFPLPNAAGRSWPATGATARPPVLVTMNSMSNWPCARQRRGGRGVMRGCPRRPSASGRVRCGSPRRWARTACPSRSSGCRRSRPWSATPGRRTCALGAEEGVGDLVERLQRVRERGVGRGTG